MKNTKNISRRKVLKNIGLGLGASLGFSSVGKALAASCGLGETPQQTEGPFYPIKNQADKNNDLTVVMGKPLKALGEQVALIGVVTDQNCNIVEGALVEIWQACASGKYNHPSDPNQSKLDPNFQYWGQSVTNSKGEYFFKTIIPGSYPATTAWVRPPHIHMKVQLRGYEALTTQVYFSGNKYNNGDRILQSLSSTDKAKVIINFKPTTSKSGKCLEGQFAEPCNAVGTFNINLKLL